MTFTPKPTAQLAADLERDNRRHPPLLRCGLYDFVVARAREGADRRGLPALRLTLRVHAPGDDGRGYNGGGRTERLVVDCLPANDPVRLWQFARTIGLEDCYTLGRLEAAQCQGQPGTCKIGVEPGRLDGRGGRFPDRNRVMDYICDPAQVGVCF